MEKLIKFFLFTIIIFSSTFAAKSEENTVYTQTCVKCHEKLPVSLDKYFYRYLLVYSSQKDVKKAMFSYLKDPQENTTIMPNAFIKRFGIKKASALKEEQLLKALDIYWEKYKIFGKLK